MEKNLNKELEIIDLTSMQAHVLIYLYKNKNNIINQRDIEREFELTNPTVNGILNRLENKGFIAKAPKEKVDEEKEKLEKYIKLLEETENSLKRI